MRRWMIATVVLIVVLVTGTALIADLNDPPPSQKAGSYIVQASSLNHARVAVIDAGGLITHELGIINAVGAELTDTQLEFVRDTEGVRRVYEDRELNTSVVDPTLASAANGSCSLSANEHLEFDSNDIYWTVTNTSLRSGTAST